MCVRVRSASYPRHELADREMLFYGGSTIDWAALGSFSNHLLFQDEATLLVLLVGLVCEVLPSHDQHDTSGVRGDGTPPVLRDI